MEYKQFRKWTLIGIGIALVAILYWWSGFKNAGASQLNEQVCFCHNMLHNPHTICTSNQGQINGHTTHVNNGSDTLGACVFPTPTIYVPSPTPSVEPTGTPEVTPTPEPTATPEATPTPEVRTLSEAGVPQRTCSTIEFTPSITGFERLSPTSVKFTWTATDPINDYFVYFGLSADKLEWNTFVQDAHEVTLNDLPANVSIWAQVFGTDNVCIGNGSLIVDP